MRDRRLTSHLLTPRWTSYTWTQATKQQFDIFRNPESSNNFGIVSDWSHRSSTPLHSHSCHAPQTRHDFCWITFDMVHSPQLAQMDVTEIVLKYLIGLLNLASSIEACREQVCPWRVQIMASSKCCQARWYSRAQLGDMLRGKNGIRAKTNFGGHSQEVECGAFPAQFEAEGNPSPLQDLLA